MNLAGLNFNENPGKIVLLSAKYFNNNTSPM